MIPVTQHAVAKCECGASTEIEVVLEDSPGVAWADFTDFTKERTQYYTQIDYHTVKICWPENWIEAGTNTVQCPECLNYGHIHVADEVKDTYEAPVLKEETSQEAPTAWARVLGYDPDEMCSHIVSLRDSATKLGLTLRSAEENQEIVIHCPQCDKEYRTDELQNPFNGSEIE